MKSEALSPNEVAARLDRLPVGRFHRRFLALIALGAWFDMYDNFVAGTLAAALPAAGVVPEAQGDVWFSALGLFMASLPLGMFLGTIVFGLASDYVGRRFGFVAMLLLYSLATLAGGAGYYPLAAIAGPAAGFILILVTRFLAGAGIGAENVIIDAYVSEMVPRQIRGRAAALVHAVAFTAFPAAALLARFLAPKSNPKGWWLLMVIGSLGALFTWYFRRRLPESPRWSAMMGRSEEANKTLQNIEREVEKESGPLPSVTIQAEPPPVKRMPLRTIFAPPYLPRTLMLVAFHLLQTVGYYGFMHWLVKLLLAKGIAYDRALDMQFAASVLAPIGPLLGLWSIERWQRKRLIVALVLSLATMQIAFGLAEGALVITALAALIVVSLNWFSAVFHAYQSELFPTEARATGIGFAYAWSRVSMVVLNLFMPKLIESQSMLPYQVMASAMIGVAVIVFLFGPLTNAMTLEELSPSR